MGVCTTRMQNACIGLASGSGSSPSAAIRHRSEDWPMTQEAFLGLLGAFFLRYKRWPTYRDLVKATGLKYNSIRYWARKLAHDGQVVRGADGHGRVIVSLDPYRNPWP